MEEFDEESPLPKLEVAKKESFEMKVHGLLECDKESAILVSAKTSSANVSVRDS